MPASTALMIRSLRTYRHVARTLASTASLVNDGLSTGDLGSFKLKGYTFSSHFEPKAPLRSLWYYAAAGLIALSSTCSAGQTASAFLQERNMEDHKILSSDKKPKVIFVLGGPGSGKGTQCAKIVDNYGFIHLSAGDLLRAEIKSGSKEGTMIHDTIKEGKIVPSEVTVRLLQKAMRESGKDKFLIDGFPRNQENRAAFEAITGIEPEFVIFLSCTEEEMEKRLLGRNQGRVDDNIETIKKRFKVFLESSLPVVQEYEERRKVQKINASRGIEEVFESIQPLFRPFLKEDLLRLTKDLLQSIDTGDYERYKKLCDPNLTAFEPEAQGHLVEGLEFHKFYFDQQKVDFPISISSHSELSSPKIILLGDNVGLVTYTRLRQNTVGQGKTTVGAYNETRVWERKKDSTGQLVWKNVHFHRSRTLTDN